MKLWTRLRCLVDRGRLERDLAEEMRAHRQMLEQQYAGEGLPPEEARQTDAVEVEIVDYH